MNAPTESPVRQYARLQLMAQRYRASNVPIPHAIQVQMQDLETFAANSFTPEQGERLLQMVRAEQATLLQQEQAEQGMLGQLQRSREEVLSQALRNAGAKRVSQVAGLGRDGKELNEAQLAQAAAKGKYTVPGKVPGVEAARARMSQTMGREVTRAEYKRTLDQLDYLFDNPNAMSKYLDSQVGDDGVERAKLERRIRDTVIAAGLVERNDKRASKDDFKPVTVEMTTEERRRLDIADRVMAHESPEAFIETIRDRGTEGSIRAALVDAVESAPDIDPAVGSAAQDLNAVNRYIDGEDV